MDISMDFLIGDLNSQWQATLFCHFDELKLSMSRSCMLQKHESDRDWRDACTPNKCQMSWTQKKPLVIEIIWFPSKVWTKVGAEKKLGPKNQLAILAKSSAVR